LTTKEEKKMKKTVIAVLMAVMVLALPFSQVFAEGSQEQSAQQEESLSVLVFITGVLAGSPPYQAMANGAEEFAENHANVSVKVYEAGFNQAEWEEKLTSLVATQKYDVVIGSNPALPEICASVGEKFPDQKFILADSKLSGNDQIATYLYNQYEQSLFLGYLAGLVTKSDMDYANGDKKIGFLAAQEYPLLTKQIVPGFIDGAKMVDSDIELDYRVIGSWSDASKAAELSTSMCNAGVDVFAAIAGGASQGLFKTAQEKGAYIVYHNTDVYEKAPGYVVGCGKMKQEKLTKEILNNVIDGEVEYGTAQTIGVPEGYLDFIADAEEYREYVPQDIRDEFETFMQDLRNGNIDYTVPEI
jgi:simple sugar transport system substrate-binding protein